MSEKKYFISLVQNPIFHGFTEKKELALPEDQKLFLPSRQQFGPCLREI
jgi:hypothetical protein